MKAAGYYKKASRFISFCYLSAFILLTGIMTNWFLTKAEFRCTCSQTPPEDTFSNLHSWKKFHYMSSTQFSTAWLLMQITERWAEICLDCFPLDYPLCSLCCSMEKGQSTGLTPFFWARWGAAAQACCRAGGSTVGNGPWRRWRDTWRQEIRTKGCRTHPIPIQVSWW